MAVTLHNGATTANTPTAWVAVPEKGKYFIQSAGVLGTVQFSNDGTNLAELPAPSNGGPGVLTSTSGTSQSTFVGQVNPTPFAFMRFLPSTTVASATITVTSV